MSRVEQPDYTVSAADGAFEVRAYGPIIVAEAQVKGVRKAAVNEGFRLLAGYIFGGNTPNAKIAMTAPVQQKQAETISMTAPVTQQSQGDGLGDGWTVRFTMPSNWTMETLPAPIDPRVKLVPVPAKRFLAIRFSGTANDTAIEAKLAELRGYASARSLATTG